MFKVFGQMIDRVFFSINFIIAMQLPSFIVQYGHRISGHLAEANLHLDKYQAIADLHYQKSLTKMVAVYGQNSDPGIQASSKIITELLARIELLTAQVYSLTNGDYVSRIYQFFKSINLDIAKATLAEYQLTIPLNINAISTGLIIAVSMSLFISLVSYVFSTLIKKSYQNPRPH